MEYTKELMEKIEGKPVKERTELFVKMVQNLSDIMEVRLKDIKKHSSHCPLCHREFKE